MYTPQPQDLGYSKPIYSFYTGSPGGVFQKIRILRDKSMDSRVNEENGVYLDGDYMSEGYTTNIGWDTQHNKYIVYLKDVGMVKDDYATFYYPDEFLEGIDFEFLD